MRLLDYFLFKIYKSYKWLHCRAPWLVYYGPVSQASNVAALYPIFLLISLTLYLNIWGAANAYLRFFMILFFLLAYAGLAIFLERRVKKVYARYVNESRKQNILGVIGVNLFILICLAILAITLIKYF